MKERLNNILLPFLVENYNPEKVYQYQHPFFQGCGYRAYQTLLIVPPAESRERFCDLQAQIEKLNLEGHGYLFCFQKHTTLAEALGRGHLFYSLVCQRKNLLYAKGHQKLDIAPPELLRQVILKAKIDFAACMERITAFLDGARFYQGKEDLSMAAFMLQQVVELLFRAVELALRAGEERCHLIRTHFAPCKPMLPRMCAAFSPMTESDRELLQVLNDAYLNVRYREQYVISEQEFREAMKRASQMIAIAPREVAATIRLAEIMAKERNNPIPTIYENTNQ